jgi:EmrB/QacA subfamily drug resistance transporter
MIALDTTVVATVLSTIRRELGASVETLEWTVNAYVLSFGVLLLTGAALGDRFGRRRMFVIGLAVFAAASAACALSPNIGTLIAARAVQGGGAALVLPLAMTQLSAAFPAERRGKALGVFTGVAGLATFSGPFVGGAVAQGLAWQWVFWLNIPIGVAIIGLVPATVAETFGPNTRLDFGGVVLATGAALGLVWGLVRGNSAGWYSVEVVASLLAGALLVIGFVGWEGRTGAPMLPMRLFRVRAFSTANAANFCLIGSMYGALFLMAQYLQTALGYQPLAAGLRLMPWTGLLMICAPIAGTFADRLGERPFLAGGLVLQAAGLLWLALVAAPALPYPRMFAPLVLSGLGISMALPAAQKAVVGAVRADEIGQASGAFNALRQIGGAFGIAAIAAVFAATGSYTSPRRFTDGFAAAVGFAAALALIGAVIAASTPGRKVRPLPGTCCPLRTGPFSKTTLSNCSPSGRPPYRPSPSTPAPHGSSPSGR